MPWWHGEPIQLKGKNMIIFNYESKKKLKENIGQRLRYIETSMFGNEYVSNGTLTGANRPHITGKGREFFAQVTIENDIITKVS
jgi:hypothetical protein